MGKKSLHTPTPLLFRRVWLKAYVRKSTEYMGTFRAAVCNERALQVSDCYIEVVNDFGFVCFSCVFKYGEGRRGEFARRKGAEKGEC